MRTTMTTRAQRTRLAAGGLAGALVLLATGFAPAASSSGSTAPTAASYAQASSQVAEDESEPSGGPVIDHFAGNGFGEGGPAEEAALVGALGMAADGQGNLYVADTFGDRLLKVSAEGTVTGVANVDAAIRICGYALPCTGGGDLESVDGLPARHAKIQPFEVAVARDGDLLVLGHSIHDCGLYRIDAETGIIDTLIETPPFPQHYCGSDRPNPVDGPIESATMAYPVGGMGTGPDGSVYFVDARTTADANGPTGTVIRRIDPSLSTVSTVAGGGAQPLADGVPATDARIVNNPDQGRDCISVPLPQVAVDPEGLLHFTCRVNGWGQIWRVEESGVLRLVAGGGDCCERRDGEDAVGAFFNGFSGMAIVGEGGPHAPGIYATEAGAIVRISPDGKAYTIHKDSGLWAGGQPHAMVVDSAGRLFAAGGQGFQEAGVSEDWGEHVGHRVYRIDPDGTPIPAVGNGSWTYHGQDDGTPATEAGFGKFSEIAADAAGNVYVRDRFVEKTPNQRAVVRRIDADTGQVTRVAGTLEPGPVKECRPEVSGPAMDAVICNSGIYRNNGIAVDSGGNVYLTASYSPPCRSCSNPSYSAIYRVDAQTGTIADIWSCGSGAVKDLPTCVGGGDPVGLYVDDSDTVYSLHNQGRVNRLDPGQLGWVATPVANITGGGYSNWSDLTGDAQGRLYALHNNRVYRVELGPVIVTPMATKAQLHAANGVAVDADGNLLIADHGFGALRVLRVDADTGSVDTIAGDGACCGTDGTNQIVGAYGGDGGPAVEASLTIPSAVEVLPDGRLLIVDGRRLRVLDSTGPDPEPTPTPTPTPTATGEPTPTPTPTPSESPAPDTTEVSFTARSQTSAQYSDETLLEARLTDSGGDPIEDAELAFELTGAESARSFTATTDSDGIAAVTPTLEEMPGPYQLTVRYAGDDEHEPSADTTSFVVDKEDSALELTEEKGKDKALVARLSDADTPADGIAGRTIDFYAGTELLGSATTDDDGVATFEPPKQKGKKQPYEARFEGDDFYLASSDQADKGGKGGNGAGG